MKAYYNDIIIRIKEKPKWYDENGVPRYDKFYPSLCPDIYATEVVLLKIQCQNCHKSFLVELHYSIMDAYNRFNNKLLSENYKYLHYGDPPIHSCVGDTENCEDIEIIEFWQKKKARWKRIKKYEVKYN